MASDNSSFFSNGFPSDNLTFGGDIYKVSLAPRYPLGFRVGRADGNCYRYGHMSTGVAAGYLVAAQTLNCGSLPAAATGTSGTGIAGQVEAPGATGSRFVQITVTGFSYPAGAAMTVVKNCWAGGYLMFTDGIGTEAGSTYRIKGNTAAGTPTATTAIIELYEPLQAAVGASTVVNILSNPYSDLIVHTAAAEAATNPVGVTISKTVTTTYPFAFIQTWGVATVLADAHTITPGEWVQGSVLTAGAITPILGGSVQAAGTLLGTVVFATPIVGYCMLTGVASKMNPIYLTISR
jgi:hypothetical protein